MFLKASLAAATLALAAVTPAAHAQKAFATPEAAADAFIEAAATNDDAAMRTILGADYRRFVPAESIKADDRTAFLYATSQGRKIVLDRPDMAHLAVGKDGWTLPLPLYKSAEGWRFDIRAGIEEMRIRRIGRNELATMQALLAYVDAQKDYARADRDGDGTLEYAQRFISSPGKRDGLIWADDPASPLGTQYANETKDGIYHGYRFRILTGQGAAAPGGARAYVVKGHMTQGFAAVAWPAKWNDTGVMTFMISHDGRIYQKNLGANTDALARAVKSFVPDAGWAAVPDAQIVRP